MCGKTILCARPKGRELWSRVRSIPRHIDYRGPFLLCRHITQGTRGKKKYSRFPEIASGFFDVFSKKPATFGNYDIFWSI